MYRCWKRLRPGKGCAAFENVSSPESRWRWDVSLLCNRCCTSENHFSPTFACDILCLLSLYQSWIRSFGLIMEHLPPLRILNSASRAKCIRDDKKRAWIVRYGQRNGALGENRDDVCRLKCHSQELAGLDIRYNVTLTQSLKGGSMPFQLFAMRQFMLFNLYVIFDRNGNLGNTLSLFPNTALCFLHWVSNQRRERNSVIYRDKKNIFFLLWNKKSGFYGKKTFYWIFLKRNIKLNLLIFIVKTFHIYIVLILFNIFKYRSGNIRFCGA